MSELFAARRRSLVFMVVFALLFTLVLPFTGTSFANHVGQVILTPDQDSAAVGTCNQFNIQVQPAPGQPQTSVAGVPIDVNINQPTNQTGTAQVGFCDPNQPAPSQGQANTANQQFTTDQNGQIVFGVFSTSPGTMSVTAFADENNDNQPQPNESQDTSTKTWTPGGANAVTALDCFPNTDRNPEGTAHNFTCTATGQGGPVPGVTVVFDVESGPNAEEVGPTNCTTTNNHGVANCSYTDPVAAGSPIGTDSIRAWVNQNQQGQGQITPGFDQGEPNEVITKQWEAAPQNLRITLTCGGGNTSACQNPLTDNNEVFTATVTNQTGTAQNDVQVSFTIDTSTNSPNASDNDTTINPVECRTNAQGLCSTTATNPNPQFGDFVTVTATIAGQVPATSASATKRWANVPADARTIDCTPKTATNRLGTSHTVSCLVNDRSGNPVQGVQVTFSEDGTGRISSSNPGTTDSAGRADVVVSTTTNDPAGTQSITGTITTQGTQCTQAAGNPTGAPAGKCADTVTKTWTAGATPPPEGFQREISLETSKRRVTFGRNFTLTATITLTNPEIPGSCRAGVEVILSRTVLGGTDSREIARGTTDDQGIVSFRREADRSANYVASVPRQGDCAAAASEAEPVLVRKAVRLKFRPDSTPRRGTVVRIIVSVAPCAGHQGDKVTLWKAIQGVMAKVGSKRSNDQCRAKFRRVAKRDSVWQGRAPKSDADHLGGKSRRKALDVRR